MAEFLKQELIWTRKPERVFMDFRMIMRLYFRQKPQTHIFLLLCGQGLRVSTVLTSAEWLCIWTAKTG